MAKVIAAASAQLRGLPTPTHYMTTMARRYNFSSLTLPGDKDGRRQFFDAMPQAMKREWEIYKATQEARKPECNASLAERARRRMARVDDMEPETRAMVYEFGLEIIQCFLDHRVTYAPNIAFLIRTVLKAERPHSIEVRKLFGARGVRSTSIIYLIDTVLNADYDNGQARFRFNSGPNRKPNPLNQDDDDEAYFVIGPAITAPLS